MKPIYVKLGRTGGRVKRTEGVGASGEQQIEATFFYKDGGNSRECASVTMHVNNVTNKAVLRVVVRPLVKGDGNEDLVYEFPIT